MTTSQHTCSLSAIGDIMLHGKVQDAIDTYGDHLHPWQKVSPSLGNADILFGNLETLITQKSTAEPGTLGRYKSPPGTAKALQSLGFSIVNLGHNHSYDWGPEGVETTIAELDTAGIAWAGIGKSYDDASRPAIVSCPICGRKFGFFCFTGTYNTLDKSHDYVAAPPLPVEELKPRIATLRSQCDLIVVSIHGGACLNPWPSPEMLKWCRDAADAGADVVLGHHAHVMNGIETRGSSLIAYALPDFVRSFPWEPDEAYERMVSDKHDTFILDISIGPDKKIVWNIVPAIVDSACQPYPAPEPDATRIREKLDTLSRDISDGTSTTKHYAHASQDFSQIYGASLWRTFKKGGIPWLVRRVVTLKPYHVAIVVRALRSKIGWSTRQKQ